MFVLSKWQRVALPTCWRASVRALFYCYHTFLDHRTNSRRKVRAMSRVSASGAPNNVPNCHLDKTNMANPSQHLFSRNRLILVPWILSIIVHFYQNDYSLKATPSWWMCHRGVNSEQCWKTVIEFAGIIFTRESRLPSVAFFGESLWSFLQTSSLPLPLRENTNGIHFL